MLDNLENRSTPVLRKERKLLQETHDNCAEVFRGMHTDNAWNALNPISEAIRKIGEELGRRGC